MCAEDYAIAYSKWQNYFCEAGVRTVFNKSQFFSNNPLWDLFGRTISVRQVWEQSWMKAHATKVRVSNNLNYKHGWFTDEVWEWCLRTLPWVNYGAEFTSRLIVWKFGVDREAYATLSFMHTSSPWLGHQKIKRGSSWTEIGMLPQEQRTASLHCRKPH